MTQIVGRQSTGNINTKNIPIDLSPQIYKLWPEISPFLTFSQAIPAKSCMQPKFEWFDNDDRPDTDTVNGAIDDSTTTLVVDDGTKFLPEETCVIVDKTTGAYGEHIRITAISGNSLTIVRGVDGTTAAAIADEDIVYNISDAQTEGSALPSAIAVKLNDNFSYAQIIRTVTEYTKTFMRTDLIVDPNAIHSRREEKTREHKRKMEKAFIFGRRSIENGSGSQPRRSMSGLLEFIEDGQTAGIDNTLAAGGTLTEAAWDQFLETKAFAYGSQNKICLCSRRLLSVINTFAKGKLEITQDSNMYGMNVTKYRSPFGELTFAIHEQFTKAGNLAAGGIIYDQDQVKMRVLNGAPLVEFESDVVKDGVDGGSDVWRSEVGLEYGSKATLALITGANAAG